MSGAALLLAACDFAPFTVTADLMTCVAPDFEGQCTKYKAEGGFTVTVDAHSQRCFIMYKNYATSQRDVENGNSLVYVDRNNWKCTGGEPRGLNVETVISMEGGVLKITSEGTDKAIPPIGYRIKRTDTIVSRLMYYALSVCAIY